MFGDLFDSPWKILIVAVVIIVLFGSRKLPDAARSLGRSMRILKSEVQGMHDDEEASAATATASSTTTQTPAQIEAKPPVDAKPQADAHSQMEQLQQQINDLKQQQPSASGAAVGNQASAAEAQRTQQSG